MAVKSLSSAQLELFAIPSPCIGVCQSGDNGYCIGCFRTRDERVYWLQVDDATKRAIISACHRRKSRTQRVASEKQSALTPAEVQRDMFSHTK
jgi:predicted Fe-S protein YdhL (DUF1289 family)